MGDTYLNSSGNSPNGVYQVFVWETNEVYVGFYYHCDSLLFSFLLACNNASLVRLGVSGRTNLFLGFHFSIVFQSLLLEKNQSNYLFK